MPDWDKVEKFNEKLDSIGNIKSDGRPILGLDARILLEYMLEFDPDGLFHPGPYLDSVVLPAGLQVRV